MEGEEKVFSSNIIRINKKLKNNLYDVINIHPAKPVNENIHKYETCDFTPRTDKYYVPKKKNGVKVRTVRDLRNTFEKDIFSYLPEDLEKQRNLLMRRIRSGSLKEEQTKQIAKSILESDSPVTRQIWQMVMNINPLDCKYTTQFVLCNGKHIQINGSKGGKSKFITNYDIGKVKKPTFNKRINKRPFIPKKRGLLHNSLNVKFKPGPLTRKLLLDTSNQRYQFGDMDLINLPKVGLDVQPTIGKALAPAISTYIQNTFLYDGDGTITKTWADFSVSVLGTLKNRVPAQINEDCVTFDVNYKCHQRRVLMRHDSDKTNILYDVSSSVDRRTEEESTILSEVKNIMKDILDSVEISLSQDNMYFAEDDPRDHYNDTETDSPVQLKSISSKNKPKRKCNELNRLDVTVITIPKTSEPSKSDKCFKAFCTLGCVCESIRCSFNLKRHCGRLECMFNCKCDFSKYNTMDTIDNDCSDILPGLVNLDKKLALNLAKEEQKFHQTVIFTDDKSIHLKSTKRNWKTSKKYAEFYSKMRLKAEIDGSRMLSIQCVNLDCKDVEPWCMVHNLYKCFCKGKFTETSIHNKEDIKVSNNECENTLPATNTSCNDGNVEIKDLEVESNDFLKEPENIKPSDFGNISETAITLDNNSCLDVTSHASYSCARVVSYTGRKYDDSYYSNANQKIKDMEKNDKKLQKRLTALLSQDDKSKSSQDKPDKSQVSSISANEQKTTATPDVVIIPDNTANSTSSLNELLSNVIENTVKESSETSDVLNKPREKRLLTKSKLVAWLESSYKQYKQTPQENLVKLSLEPPKNGKVALYSWEFILSRYREKKNYFLLTKQKPFRIFMAVDIKNVFFENCMNISNIPLSEIEDYPITVRNLLTNARNLKDNFCILHGLSFCWELVGSVAKVKDKPDSKKENDKNAETNETSPFVSVNKDTESQTNSGFNADLDNIPIVDLDDSDTDSNHSVSTGEDFQNPLQEDNKDLSKWFLMTIVNDFTEIRFYNKGFFVKYDSVIKAINVARISGKTVRLSSQRCVTAQSDPQFGIYAIPSKEKYCVFIGPYENNERLGIETVKNSVVRKIKDSTRGIWITTNKLDNINVVDNPLLYLPSHNLDLDNMVTLESDGALSTQNDYENVSVVEINSETIKNKMPVKKIIKPIKIKKGGFYRLGSNNVLKNSEQLTKQVKKNVKPIVLNKSLIISPNKTLSCLLSRSPISAKTEEFKLFSEKIKELNKSPESKPIAEIAPQIKDNTKINTSETRKRKFEGGMYVLKPEEINLKSWENTELFDKPKSSKQNDHADGMDIENFISKSVICADADVCIISDDDEEEYKSEPTGSCKNVWIVCKNIDNLGWIPARKDHRNNLSFEIPGFKYTDYYSPEEAYEKINQVLSRKVYVPMNINLEWHFVESEAEIWDKKKLSADDLCSDFVLTKKGLCHRYNLMGKLKGLNSQQDSTSSEECNEDTVPDKKPRVLSDTEESSSTLEDEGTFLLDKLIKTVELKEALTKVNEELLKDLNDKLISNITVVKEET
ncbi:uncharacterized protein LOC116766272 [Danaus plexippus]|uniref:uncharacterized protein LOC116766272 n=1 Tax=Danaus plexippus TaxID=13037 RepID=UPI002AB31A3C|nr:uncharacterized protein LOC116766272 [Danaus plexippus]XP_032511969.2 uncharacterized protein LOC116766272 [Danaus plexippus]XP_061378821.1 uncharacterized protein LOC116766272 [Danaus plexippus]XP_061378822.1 uncharacterized protein LOC116766272 [Danaus plexippus]